MDESQLSRLACDRCYRRKARCDKGLPSCSSCLSAQTACCYNARGSTSRSEYVEALERRLRQVEAKNQVLMKKVRGAQQTRSSTENTAYTPITMVVDVADSQQDDEEVGQLEINETENEVTNQVFSLSLNAGRHKQYLGSASGAILANLLGVHAQSEHVDNNNDHEILFRRFPLNTGISDSSRNTLPSQQLARNLLAAYLSYDHLCYPYLHPQTLIDNLTRVYSEENYYETHPVAAFSLDMVFAISTAQVHRYSWQVMSDAETHHERATSKLGKVLESGGLLALQSLMLLCQYRMLSVSHSFSASLWHLLGMATRLGLEMGLHREAAYAIRPGMSPSMREHAKQELEIKRRCFWSLFGMDRIVSNTLGRSMAINLHEVDTQYPLVENEPVPPYQQTTTIDDILRCPRWPANTAIFVHITRLRVITGRILSELHNTPKSRMPDSETGINIRKQLGDDLDHWKAGVANLPLIESNVVKRPAKSIFESPEWYNLLYHNSILMLYRPIHSLSDFPQTSDVLERIYHSARESISSYAYLHKIRIINYTWITLHAVFLVALSYVYAVRTHFCNKRLILNEQRKHLMPSSHACLATDPTLSQIIRDTRACSTVLIALSERWNVGRGCHEAFAKLTDAVLSEASEYYQFSAQDARIGTQSLINTENRLDSTLLADTSMTQRMLLPPTHNDTTFQYSFEEFQDFFANEDSFNAFLCPPFDMNMDI